MKTLVLSMISIAATVAAMTACTSESDEINNVVEAKVPIELNAGVMEITTKTAIKPGEAFEAKVIASKTPNDYSTLLWTDANAGNIKVATDKGVAFDPVQYYPANGSTIYMVGIAPQPKEAISNGTVNYTITGDEDIMYAGQISGAKKETASTSKVLSFNHLLTQLKVTVIADSPEAIAAWGTIESIEVIDAATALTLNLKDGAIGVNTTDSKTKNLALIGFAKDLTIPDASKSEEAKEAGYCMLLPKTSDLYQLSVKTSAISNAVSIPLQGLTTLDASTAYTVKLTFKSTNVNVTATAGAWNENSDGSGIVE